VGIDFDARVLELFEQRVEIVDAVVDHEAGFAGAEILRRVGEDGPGRDAFGAGLGAVSGLKFAPLKGCSAAVWFALDTEVLLVPVVELLGVFRFEEDSANAGYAFHEAPFLANLRLSAGSVVGEAAVVVTLLDDFGFGGRKIMLSGGVEGLRDEAGGLGYLDGLGAALGAKLVKEAAGMGLNGVFADEEAGGDFAIA